jgi:adenylate cyclase
VYADNPGDPLAAFHAGRLDAGESDVVLNRAA